MDLDALRASPIGQLVPIAGNDRRRGEFSYFAYVPDPLPAPDDLQLSSATWNVVFEAGVALGGLRLACEQLPDPKLLIAPALAREALDTSALEGTYAALSDVLEARLGSAPESAQVAEVRAYEEIAHAAFAWVRERPLTLGLLADLQGDLVAHAVTPTRDPGRVRTHQVVIGARSGHVEDARFIPPPPGDQLAGGLEAWLRWVQTDQRGLPSPLRVALAHYQFETLHPFGDGNGRVGRLVALLMMLQDGTIPEPAMSLSPWLLRRRETYQRLLLTTSATGDWNPWVAFFCEGIAAQAGRAVGVASSLMAWTAEVRRQINDHRWSGLIAPLAETLVEWPVVTIPWVIERFDVTFPTASSAVKRLVQIGALTELTGRRSGRVFGATAVMEIVESM